MLMASARGVLDRVLAMVIVVAAVLLHHSFTSASGYIVAGSALLLFLPEVPVPFPVKLLVSEIAGSSMFMYLGHFQVKSLIIRLFHGPMPWLALFAAILFGSVFARAYNWLEHKVRAFVRTHGEPGVARMSPDVVLADRKIEILPLGMQVVADRFRDDRYLDAAEAHEARLGRITSIDPKQ
jgi:hypothetical protein